MSLTIENNPPMVEKVVLVDPEDRPLGTMEKMEAHRQGVLHRAFSVFVFNSKGDLLLHRRATEKYHSGGLLGPTRACCSHSSRPDETVVEAAQRRLVEEMGMRCQLEPKFSFVYRADLDHGMIEHELDHVLIGYSDVPPEPIFEEVTHETRTTCRCARSRPTSPPTPTVTRLGSKFAFRRCCQSCCAHDWSRFNIILGKVER